MDIINILYENIRTERQHINILKDSGIVIEFNNLKCFICYEEFSQEEILFTKCNHFFCINCIIENLNYNSSCPLCREILTIRDLYYIDDLCMNGRAHEIIKLLNKLNGNSIIYVNNNKHRYYLIKYFKKNGINTEIYKQKNEFLCNELIKNLIIINQNDNLDFNNIILYDIGCNIKNLKTQLEMNNIEDIKIYHLIYDIIYDKVKIK